MGSQINSLNSNEITPFIDPDEGYIIFASNRSGGYGTFMDLYISFKNSRQEWSDPINMGYEINSTNAFYPVVTSDKQYLFFLSAKPGDIGYNPYWINADIIDSILVLNIPEPQKQAESIELFQNQPNPFLTNTTISFELKFPTTVSFEIYDILGKKRIDLIKDKTFQAGKHSVYFDASLLPDGIYFYVLKPGNNNSITRKMIKLS
jgi:hypothetical protein